MTRISCSRTSPKKLFCVALLALLALAVTPVAGAAGSGAPRSATAQERRLHALEVAELGPEHAREHAIERRNLRRQIRRWKRMTPAHRRRARIAAHRRSVRIATESVAETGTPDQVGSWTTAPFPLPNYAIHAAMLPTGKVLFWGYPPPQEGGRQLAGLAALWDPSLGTGEDAFTDVDPPVIDVDDGPGSLDTAAPLYCSGQSFLPDGELLAMGGTRAFPNNPNSPGFTGWAGLNRVFTFNPWTEQWTEQPRMDRGRWYPTQVELGDGRTLVMAGLTDDAPEGDANGEAELFTPGSGSGTQGAVTHVASADRNLSLYPHLTTMPSGDVLLSGPDQSESGLLSTQSFTWSALPASSVTRIHGTSVLLPGGPEGSSSVMQLGGESDIESKGFHAATATTEALDTSQPAPSWSQRTPEQYARSNQNVVLLPDGSMVAVGGGSGFDSGGLGGYPTYDDNRTRQVEIWDPTTGTWRLGPAQLEDRTYHSTAVLLPDGRVWSAGDDFHPSEDGVNASLGDSAEIYSPPYLFKGDRPVIDSAPGDAHWGDVFGVGSPSPGISRAVLMAPSATTHGVDMQEREIDLRVVNRVDGQGVDVAAPPSSNVAPPGYYMLFLLNDSGVPSVASWVRLGADAPDQPSLGDGQPPPPPAATPGDQAAPEVGVRLVPNRRARERGHLFVRVGANEGATVQLTFSLHSAGKGKKATAPPVTKVMALPGGGSGELKLHFAKGLLRRTRKIDVDVTATDAAGNSSTTHRVLTVG